MSIIKEKIKKKRIYAVQKKAKGESLKLYVVFQPFLVFFKVLLLPMN